MPAFYPNRPLAGQMPLTPPGSGSGYGYSTMHYPQGSSYMPHPSLEAPQQDGMYDYQQSYMSAVAPAPLPAFQYGPSNYSSTNSLPPINNYYDPNAAAILPPLRVDDRAAYADEYHRRAQHDQHARERQQRQAVKEEKATGGVSATLDYDMERMTDFVAQAAQSMYGFHLSPICVADIDMSRSFRHAMQCPPSFRKWVLQVLSATRLPSATILLSLHYLSDRVTDHPESIVIGENQIYRLLAVSLILGSKFLDDNTFINRSWSDVTAIKVSELNQLELNWLRLIRYRLHVDPMKVNGLQAWIDAWKEFDVKHSTKQQQLARLSPLDTNLHRQNGLREHRFSPYPSPYSSTSTQPYVTPVSTRQTQFSQNSYSSSDSWQTPADRSGYDDYYKRQNRCPSASEYDEMVRRAPEDRTRQAPYHYPHMTQHSFYQTPTYSVWDQPWNAAHRFDCACSACACQQHYRSYHLPPSYASQTVVA